MSVAHPSLWETRRCSGHYSAQIVRLPDRYRPTVIHRHRGLPHCQHRLLTPPPPVTRSYYCYKLFHICTKCFSGQHILCPNRYRWIDLIAVRDYRGQTQSYLVLFRLVYRNTVCTARLKSRNVGPSGRISSQAIIEQHAFLTRLRQTSI